MGEEKNYELSKRKKIYYGRKKWKKGRRAEEWNFLFCGVLCKLYFNGWSSVWGTDHPCLTLSITITSVQHTFFWFLRWTSRQFLPSCWYATSHVPLGAWETHTISCVSNFFQNTTCAQNPSWALTRGARPWLCLLGIEPLNFGFDQSASAQHP